MRAAWMLLAPLALTGCGRCGDEDACTVDLGRYFAVLPEGWDGESDLPVVLLAHGYEGSPEGYLRAPGIMDPSSERGVLLILPEGADATWSVRNTGLEENQRDEMAFVDEVLDDVESRWPVDVDRVYATGFSLGGSLVYDLACQRGDRFAAAAPTSGGFWEPLPDDCPSDPIPICHIHGENDLTWPIEGGRELAESGNVGTHASIADDVAFWRAHNECDDVTEDRSMDPLTCTVWTGCEAEVGACTHTGGHEQFDGWIERELDWLLAFSR